MILKISPKWSKFANSLFGNKSGRHCHWCRFMKSNGGSVICVNKNSKFSDGDRIRTWDGGGCAKECYFFELDKWYTKDKNYDETFVDRRR